MRHTTLVSTSLFLPHELQTVSWKNITQNRSIKVLKPTQKKLVSGATGATSSTNAYPSVRKRTVSCPRAHKLQPVNTYGQKSRLARLHSDSTRTASHCCTGKTALKCRISQQTPLQNKLLHLSCRYIHSNLHLVTI
jgi:hypothetical protein